MSNAGTPGKTRALTNYRAFPIYFEPSVGQAEPDMRYFSHTADYTLSITRGGAMLIPGPRVVDVMASSRRKSHLAAPGPVVSIKLRAPRPDSILEPDGPLEGRVNYFIGNDPAKWRTNVPIYARVVQRGVWPGVDLVYHGSVHGLECDFIIRAGADPGPVAMDFDAIDRVEIASDGDLVLHSGANEVRMLKPSVYQERGTRQLIPVSYVWSGSARSGNSHQSKQVTVGFRVGRYDKSRPLIIDPVLKYSSYLNGAAVALGTAVAADKSGNVYVTGQVFPPGLPTTAGSYQTDCFAGAGNAYGCALHDAFVMKINPSASGAKSLVYATYLGGSANGGPGFTSFFGGTGTGIAVDASGNAYVTGSTESADFPLKNAFLDACPSNAANGCSAAFVTELNSLGNGLLYSTYLSGNGTVYGGDSGAAIAVDGLGKVYVTGSANSTNFPVTTGAYKTAFPTFCPSGMVLGNCTSGFVTELNPALSGAKQLVYSTYLGGSGDGNGDGDYGTGIAVALGRIYVTGGTVSTNFPLTSGAFERKCLGCGTTKPNGSGGGDGYITVLDPGKSGLGQLYYSSYLGGGSGTDICNGIAADSTGDAWLTGQSASSDFPITPNAYQQSFPGPSAVFVTKVNPSASGPASLVYSTFVAGCCGESGNGIGVHLPNAYVTGFTASTDFPVSPDAAETSCAPCLSPPPGQIGTDSFVTILNPTLAGKNQLIYSTFLGGKAATMGSAIAVDASGNSYVTGQTDAGGFSTTTNAFQRACGACLPGDQNAFVAVFTAPSATATPTPKGTPTPRATHTPTATRTPVPTPARTATTTRTPSSTHTATPTPTPTPRECIAGTPLPTVPVPDADAIARASGDHRCDQPRAGGRKLHDQRARLHQKAAGQFLRRHRQRPDQ